MSRKKKIVIPTEDQVAEFAPKASSSKESSTEKPPEQPENQGEPGELPVEITESQAEAEQWKEKYLRAKAELLNYQRRAERNHTETLKYANAGLSKALLPIIDDLERVVASASPQNNNTGAITDGIKLTLDNLLKVLSEFHIQPIEAQGRPFDPQQHEAMMEQSSVEHPERMVLQEVVKGYQLHDRVLRPARVIVSKSTETAATDAGTGGEQSKDANL